jgi:ankyrin repeat protein
MNTIKKLVLAATITSMVTPTVHLYAMRAFFAKCLYSQQELNKQLWDAAAHRNLYAIEAALHSGADINWQSDTIRQPGYTSLIIAAEKGYEEIVQTLIDAKANLNIQNQYGQTALLLATTPAVEKRYGGTNLALIAAKANPNIPDNIGRTPLMNATYNKKTETVIALLNINANPNAIGETGETPLHNAAEHGDKKIIRALLKAGADVDLCMLQSILYSGTALTQAILHGKRNATRLLLSAGANLAIPNNSGQTPSELKTHYTHDHGADIAAEEKIRNLIRKQMITEKLLRAHTYLLNGPLAINPLIIMFTEYATHSELVPDAAVRAQRAAETRAAWAREKAQEYKDGKEN